MKGGKDRSGENKKDRGIRGKIEKIRRRKEERTEGKTRRGEERRGKMTNLILSRCYNIDVEIVIIEHRIEQIINFLMNSIQQLIDMAYRRGVFGSRHYPQL